MSIFDQYRDLLKNLQSKATNTVKAIENVPRSLAQTEVNLEKNIPLYGALQSGIRTTMAPVMRNFVPEKTVNTYLGFNQQNKAGVAGNVAKFVGEQVPYIPLMMATGAVTNPVTSKIGSLIPKGTTIAGKIASGAGKSALQFAPYGWMGALDYAETPQERIGNIAKSTASNIALGGAIGATGGAIRGGIDTLRKYTKHSPQVEKQLRDLGGRWVAGQTPVKPKGMSKAQWDFQLKFNETYKRNPYQPVYQSDLKQAIVYEAEKKGAGLSIRDVNKDINPLGKKPEILLKKNAQPGSFTNTMDDLIAPKFQKAGQILKTRQAKGKLGQTYNPAKAQEFENFIKSSGPDVKNKVGIIDYLRTPDRVLKKIGLEPQGNFIRRSYDKYLKEMPQEINKITEWSKRVSPEANQRIFRYLDGTGQLTDPNEIKVASEIKTYLKTWADRLGLPEEKRISNYITHIFEKDFIQKEFDPEIAKLISNKVAGSVYDPFTQQRLGKMGYVEDTWRALDAYVKRATRKVNMDPALKQIKKASNNLEQSQYDYVKSYVDRINLRPTKIDNLIDNSIKQIFGYRFGQRPLTALTQTGRQWIYRSTLGLNVGSAVKNLTQGANTYAKLGEKYTLIGYTKMLKNLASGSKELEDVGVLKSDLIQDRTINATKKALEKIDKGLFFFFETAEKINRGAAYYGAKSKALSKGLSEQQAIEYAKKIVRDTQFTFGSIDTPPILESDIGKTLGQFQSFSLKQSEFLGEMIKNKDIKGLIRWAAASMVMVSTIGQAVGMEAKDLIPTFRIGVPPTLQIPVEAGKTALGVPDDYGNPPTWDKTINKNWPLLVPAGVQMKKTFEGIKANQEGASLTPTGRTRFEVEQTPANMVKGAVFGQFSLPGAKEYIENMGKSKSEVIYNEFKNLSTPQEKAQLWNKMVQEGKITKSNVADVKRWFEDEKLGITPNDRKIRGLGVEDGSRARMVMQEINRLSTPQEKAELWNKYVKAKIITKDVAIQLKELLKK